MKDKGGMKMKKTVKIITMGTLLATGGLYAGGAVAPIVVPVTQTDPNPFYVGVGLLWAGTSADCITNGYDTVRLKESEWGGIIRAGWEYNQYVGIESRALKASIDSNWGEVTHYGIFLKPQYPIAEQINIYGLLGYGLTSWIVEENSSYTAWYSESGFQYGGGLKYSFSENFSIFADYTLLYDDGINPLSTLSIDSSIYTANIGISYKF